jgi:hypothetical protein
MVLCMFVDLDSDEELPESTREQSVVANDNLKICRKTIQYC